MKVLIADKISNITLNFLKKSKYNFHFDKNLKDQDLLNKINELKPEILIVRSKKVYDYHIKNNYLKLIIRAGSGYDNIDINTCDQNGTIVANCPGKNSIAVAELISSFILTSSRKLIINDKLLKNKKWEKSNLKTKGLYGKNLGIIGFGNIGQKLAERMFFFGMNIFINDSKKDLKKYSHKHSLYPNLEIPIQNMNKNDLLNNSDFISFNIPSSPQNKNFINKDLLNQIKSDSTIINTSRADIANEDDILNFLTNNKNFTYCSDVFKNEPTIGISDFDNKLASNNQVIGTHHIGASTEQAEDMVGENVVDLIKEYTTNKNILGKVNNPKNIN